ncbi:site-specific DNA-methyltransferase [Cyanobacteria bacterium FACHB-63]|nr:site-specific DNA-methyltransferase [Cyanobacteria bacterium FACHB-63]
MQTGDTWMLKHHLIYCGKTDGEEYRDCLPSNAALAIVPPQTAWSHDYLINEAKVVAVLRSQGDILSFCRSQQMPFRGELLNNELYLALFSHQPIALPHQSLAIEGIEGIVTYLISLYTKPGHFVLNPGLGNGEVLMACERMERICFAGEERREGVIRTIDRWQRWSGKAAEKTDLLG